MKKVFLFDSTLRDGAQSVGISFSVQDKLKIARILDELGVDYVEAGQPRLEPQGHGVFRAAVGTSPAPREGNRLWINAKKAHPRGGRRQPSLAARGGNRLRDHLWQILDIHVTDILRAELSENLAMIKDTVCYLKAQGKEVVYDAEHFFDGYRANPDYALQTLQAAYEAGADCLCLCDTNGGSFPDEVERVTKLVCGRFPVSVGIHAHDDGGMAVANSVLAVEAGANQVQGTLAGFGERCGNANLATILANLQLKRG